MVNTTQKELEIRIYTSSICCQYDQISKLIVAQVLQSLESLNIPYFLNLQH